MNKKLITTVGLVLILSIGSFAGCRGGEEEGADEVRIAEVERGDIIVSIAADGNLDMPRQVKLRFGTPGTVKEVYVEEGEEVREGALLAKLDDTAHKLAIASAQYNVELAMNDLVEKIHPALMGYPKLYPDPSALLRLEQAQEELAQAQELLAQGDYEEASSELRLAQHDIEATHYLLNVPEIAYVSEEYDDLGKIIYKYPQIPRAIELLGQDKERLGDIQDLMQEGEYDEALTVLQAAQRELKETHRLVKASSGRIKVSQRIGGCCGELTTQNQVPNPDYGPGDPRPYIYSGSSATGLMPLPYPDTSTSLDWLKQVEEGLQNIQELFEQQDRDEQELATLLRMAQHDVEMSRTILEDNELIFRSGLNLKASRAYSLNLQLANKGLENAKEDLMKTEILAPFDGTVVDIGVKENDQLSAFDYSSKTAVHLVDTSAVKMEGVVDEIDIYQVKVGQEAIIVVDALPDDEFLGNVTFISPFGTSEAGVVEFAVSIILEPTEVELRGGLTATADIVIAKYENVLLVPNRAVKGSAGDYSVEVVLDEATGETETRSVDLGAENGAFYEVISGLEEGEKVIVAKKSGR